MSEKSPAAKRMAIGMTYAGVTTATWGFLPILMQATLGEFKSGTIVWFRFLFAFIMLFTILQLKGERPTGFLIRPPAIGLLAGAFLSGNYFFFVEGVRLSSPSNTGVMIQIAPVLVVLAGVFIFKEAFNRRQGFGLVLAVLGFVLFFREQSQAVLDLDRYLQADALIFLSGALWAAYMTLNKYLQRFHAPQHLNLLVYGTACVTLILVADFGELSRASGAGWFLLVILGLNTVLAYGCLAEAVRYAPLSLVSVILALNPFLTMLLMQIGPQLFPEWLEPEHVTLGGYAGASVAIYGVIMVIRNHRTAEPSTSKT